MAPLILRYTALSAVISMELTSSFNAPDDFGESFSNADVIIVEVKCQINIMSWVHAYLAMISIWETSVGCSDHAEQ
jgi:hypothetical protein